MTTPRFHALGDAAVLVETADVPRACAALERCGTAGIVDIVPAYTGVAVHYDPCAFGAAPFTALCSLLTACLLDAPEVDDAPKRVVEVPVRYGGVDGPDLDDVAMHCRLDAAEVVRRHAAAEYTVVMIGFAPGFPYLRGLPPELATPRLATPREHVPAGSVGIGGAQTGIYPLQTPGGWRIIGRTAAQLFDAQADPPTLLRAGDVVRFIDAS